MAFAICDWGVGVNEAEINLIFQNLRHFRLIRSYPTIANRIRKKITLDW